MSEANPLLSTDFRIPFDAIRAEHIVPAVRAQLEDARRRMAAIEAEGLSGPPSFASTFGAFDRMTEGLERAMSIAGHLEAVATTPAIREAYSAVQPEVSAFSSSVYLSAPLYRALRSFAESAEAAALTPDKKRYVETTLADFRRAGADLDAPGKERLAAIDLELATISLKFSQNVLDATHTFEILIEGDRSTAAARLAGLPESAIDAANESAASKGKAGYRFTLQAPSYIAVMTYADDAAMRENMYRAFNTRATEGELDNRPILERMLELRREKAKLLGFETFADLAVDDRMAKTGATARAFVRDLEKKTRPFFDRENAELATFRAEVEGPRAGRSAPALAPWDVTYYAEKLRRARFDFDEEALRPYFSLERVLDGLFAIASRLYGIRIEPWADAPTWHETVRAFRMLDAADRDARTREIGGFYVDVFPRESKRDGAWMQGLISGVGPGAGPEARHLGLFAANVTPPVQGRPALLTHREVETLFHEFGHLMHHMLSKTELRSQAGTNVAWDFVELPSQIMENWTWDRGALDLFARHYETGATIPDELFTKMQNARTFRAANMQMRQLGFAEVDLALHMDFEPSRDGSVIEYARTISARFASVAPPDDYAMIASFGHLFASPVGYAGGYYSYKWAEVLDADAFSRFSKEGVLSAEVGTAFRERILSRGSSEDPKTLFVNFMGREPDPEALFERSGLR
jgi:oligopeptidase A